jgi:2-aminoadipate transaminase
LADLSQILLDPASPTPLYKQLADSISFLVQQGGLQTGERLPATRELAGQLGLNRTTVSAAYSMLEQSGVIQGHVGRGSFIAAAPAARTLDWDAMLPPLEFTALAAHSVTINFATSRPPAGSFPLSQFRHLAKQVIDGPEAENILQLGSSHGYAPLRRYLLEQSIITGVARENDDLLITNGCQQAFDLIARLFFPHPEPVLVEDPVYHGLLRVFSRAGANIIPLPVDENGLDLSALEESIVRARPRLLIVTPSFQNPTGATLSLDRRKRLLDIAQRTGLVIVENDIYSELRYTGKPLPTLKELDHSGNVILLRSYSKVSFPGLRVGWVVAPRPVIARLAEAKQISDLHSDQLSQAVLLRFAESGELARHLERSRAEGSERLQAALQACARFLPAGSTWTRPEGGMSLWIELPPSLTAENVLERCEQNGVTFLPGPLFSTRRAHRRGLRLSFGGLTPQHITRGLQILGEAAARELAALDADSRLEPVAAVV